jgi:hypothetical protein
MVLLFFFFFFFFFLNHLGTRAEKSSTRQLTLAARLD